MLEDFRNSYERDGYVSPLRILDPGDAARHRAALETAEAHVGPLHYKFKAHTFLRSPFELATRPAMLDLVEALLGPNILLYNVSYIIKEPHTSAHVCWHQDLTYWGLSSDAQVSAWLALSPATPQNGICCWKGRPFTVWTKPKPASVRLNRARPPFTMVGPCMPPCPTTAPSDALA
jgi:hypothetical protein